MVKTRSKDHNINQVVSKLEDRITELELKIKNLEEDNGVPKRTLVTSTSVGTQCEVPSLTSVGTQCEEHEKTPWSEVVKRSKPQGSCTTKATSKKNLSQKSPTPIKLNNRFSVLGEKKFDKVILIGDSNVRRLDRPVKQKIHKDKSSRVKILSYSGIGVEGLKSKIATELKRESSGRVKVLVHVGTNDVDKVESQVLLGKLRDLIRRTKDARTGVYPEICTIPSRTDKGSYVFSRSESVNNQLARSCTVEGATCLDLGSNSRFLGRDGVHYSIWGAEQVSKKLADKINSFLG